MEERILTYALSKGSGKLVSVAEVPNGLDSNCFCPECQAPLVAKNNFANKKAPHFAHASGKACIGGGLESAIHLLAKDILSERKRLFTPHYHSDYNFNNPDSLYKPGELIHFDEVLLEQRVQIGEDFIVPDAIGIVKGKQVFIEFARTHFVDEVKKWRLKQGRVACIEIDLRHLSLNKEELQFALEHPEPIKYWLINPKLDSAYQKELIIQQQKEEKKRLKSLKKEEERTEAEKRRKKERLVWLDQQKKIGFRVLKKYPSDDVFGYKVYCPLAKLKVKELEESNLGAHPLIRKILENGRWNGEFYGRGQKRYVFVGNERTEVFWANQSLAEKKKAKFLYAGLKTIQEIMDVYVCNVCKFCINQDDEEYVVCSFGAEKTKAQ